MFLFPFAVARHSCCQRNERKRGRQRQRAQVESSFKHRPQDAPGGKSEDGWPCPIGAIQRAGHRVAIGAKKNGADIHREARNVCGHHRSAGRSLQGHLDKSILDRHGRNPEHSADRSNRGGDTDLETVREEVNEARRFYTKMGWPVIDVTRRSIEETAAEIIKILARRQVVSAETLHF